MEDRIWYAVLTDYEDNDWGIGSYDLEEAKQKVINNLDIYPNGLIAAIDVDVCVGEYRYEDGEFVFYR